MKPIISADESIIKNANAFIKSGVISDFQRQPINKIEEVVNNMKNLNLPMYNEALDMFNIDKSLPEKEQMHKLAEALGDPKNIEKIAMLFAKYEDTVKQLLPDGYKKYEEFKKQQEAAVAAGKAEEMAKMIEKERKTEEEKKWQLLAKKEEEREKKPEETA